MSKKTKLDKKVEEVKETPVEEVVVEETKSEPKKNGCRDCVDGLVGDPTGSNKVCATCGGTGER